MMKYALTAIAIFALTLSAIAERPKRPESKYYESGGLQLHYTEEGAGETVLLIHGSGTTGSMNWRMPKVVEELQESYHVLIPDVRGHGRSEKPENGEYGIADVHDMIALLDHLEIEKAHVVGYSMGGMITMKLTTMFPERVMSATVGGMGWIEAGSEDAASFADTENQTRYRESIQDFGEFETTAEEMKNFPVPVRVIIGTEDPGQVMRVNKWLEIVPDLDVIYIEGANHTNCIMHEDFRNNIRQFIDTHRTIPAGSDG